MSDVSKISTENMNDRLITRINAIEDLSGLNTEDQTSFVNALNEVLGKLTIVGSIGSPLSVNDKWVDMGAKIDEIVEELKDNLSNKGIHVQGKVLSELVKMIPDIPENTEEIRANIMGMLSEAIGAPTTAEDSVNDMCTKIDSITQDFRDKLIEKGVVLEGNEKMNELVIKVDDVGSDGEEIPAKWTTKALMPSSESHAASAMANNKIYVFDGWDQSSMSGDGYYSPDLLCYDPSNNTWTEDDLPRRPGSRYASAADSVNNKIYAFSGYIGGGSYSSAVHSYDPIANSWTEKRSMSNNYRSSYACSTLGEHIYVMGGYDPNREEETAKNSCYDPSTDTWTEKTVMPVGKQFLSSAVWDNIIYVPLDTYMSCYDESTNSWTNKSTYSFPANTYGSEAAYGKIFVFGSSKTICYDIEQDSYSTLTKLPTARTDFVTAVYNNEIYVIGGEASNKAKYTNECYTPAHLEPNAAVQALVNTIGEPCTTEDSVYDICDKLEVMTDNLRDSLEANGVGVTEEDKLNSLIEKVDGVGSKAVAGDTFIVYQDLNEYNNSSHKNYGGYGKINNFRFPYVMLDGSYKISFQARGGASNLITTTYYKIDRCTDYNGNVVVESKEISTKSYENVTLSVIFDNVKKGDTFKISMANITAEGGSTTTYISRVHLTVDAAYL